MAVDVFLLLCQAQFQFMQTFCYMAAHSNCKVPIRLSSLITFDGGASLPPQMESELNANGPPACSAAPKISTEPSNHSDEWQHQNPFIEDPP